MSLITKLIISLVIAVIASTLITLLREGALIDPILLIAFFAATAATALIVRDQPGSGSGSSTGHTHRSTASDDASREQGTVKWFNISKGFGFITKDDGEEIFVHFRSIRGEGRRGLRDGQNVSFVVAESEKGPQAEDVVGEE